MSQRRVCLVTDEMYPFTAGGIGRVLHNLVEDSLRRELDLELHLLFPARTTVNPREVERHFLGKVKAHVASVRSEWDTSFDEGGVYPPPGAFTDTVCHAQSMELLLELRRLEEEGTRFDVIEFPDYRGWAFCAIQEKLLGCGLEGAQVVVRLHSTGGMLAPFERQLLGWEHMGQFELERKALLDADLVIAHIPGVAELNCSFYGFPDSWLDKVVREFPPVAPKADPVPPRGEGEPDLLFVTKIQNIKRTDVFVRGAAGFMRRFPEYRGKAVLACHTANSAYLAYVQALIPEDLRSRFLFTGPSKDRDALMRHGIVVISSDYESLNLTAYEASSAGATLVLNGACVAFAPGSPFIDGVNCYTYGGSVDGLVEALERAWRAPALLPVEWTAVPPYWETPREEPALARPDPDADLPRVSVLITNHNLGRFLPETLASIADSNYPEIEVIIVDDASTGAFDHEVLGRIEEATQSGSSGVKLIRNPVNRGLPASRNIGLRAATGDYILPLDADDCISPTFIRLAVEALERHREFDVVVPSTGYFDSDEGRAQRRFIDYALFIGDCPSLGMVANRLSCATSLMRRSLFETLRYNEEMTSYEDWDLYLRLAHAGHRFLVTNALHFHYRRRKGSMISGVNPRRHQELLFQLHQNLTRPLPSGVQLAAFLLLATPPNGARTAPAEPTSVAAGGEVPLRYGVVDTLNSTLKRLPMMHRLLKLAASGLTPEGAEARPTRYALVDLLNRTLKAMPVVHPTMKQVMKTTSKLGMGRR
ncbi:glycosyltransferase [Myxococcus llanfairpwllgwyngyllgogerychwyrndrobwllllantysiliogogogochensis]|uniref:Glycosyltransferase n=1 Tax=Myxococcus llanfairpwllgwyngyllgogerychwyrndrobwllllantysiliogogogochensis TaxID=2590453 RepID=A0A540WSJ2_9BACT|nr:glycosyltransferase [Myxococcus llanfairpwllgwyngyllgogerychwyrndrobwllllantysiliogogogochensis]TQF11354.1 glycosyltransferase [Myxococcus llanfairpwllgwyngyllgogerychwyrndrobwllllantysiliogogogochensis]